MKASKLIELLAAHMNDCDGGDFEVRVYPHSDRLDRQALDTLEVQRCWLYPGIEQIIIGTE